jgi:hypothetical protein
LFYVINLPNIYLISIYEAMGFSVSVKSESPGLHLIEHTEKARENVLHGRPTQTSKFSTILTRLINLEGKPRILLRLFGNN